MQSIFLHWFLLFKGIFCIWTSKAFSVSRSKSWGNFWGLCTLHFSYQTVMVHPFAPPSPLPALSYLNKFLQLHWSSSWKQHYIILCLTKPFPAMEDIPPIPAENPAWDVSSPSSSFMAFPPATGTEIFVRLQHFQAECSPQGLWCAGFQVLMSRQKWWGWESPGESCHQRQHDMRLWNNFLPAGFSMCLDESECQGLASCQGSKCREVSLMTLFLRNKQLSVTHYHTQVLASLKCWKTASYKQGKWVIKQLENDYTIMLCSGTISHKEDGIYPSF